MSSTEKYCTATLNYASGPGGIEPVAVEVMNGRAAENLTWEENGFQLCAHHSEVTSWDENEEIEQRYYAEMESVARELTGCDHALIAGHITRNPESARIHADYAPIQYAHSDFSESYGDLLRHRYGHSDEGAAKALRRAGIQGVDVESAARILVLQFWRNVGTPVMDLPLAFCDAQTVPREDMLAIHVPNYADGGEPFDALGMKWQAESEHQWYTFPELRVDEIVAFRTYDSACVEYDQPFYTPHCAFKDPLHEGATPRHSIEVRATCLYLN